MIQVLLGLGSNCQATENLSFALDQLNQLLSDMQTSDWYESEALNQTAPNYINLVVCGYCDLEVSPLLSQLKALETAAGRTPGCADCTLDIDLLTYGDTCGRIEGRLIPRSDLTEHAHVLLPLARLCPDLRHPSHGLRYSELWHKHRARLLQNQRLWPYTHLTKVSGSLNK